MTDGDGNDYYSLIPSQEETPEEQLILSETQQRIHRAIEELPEKYKSVVVLKYMQDCSLQEISDILNMPVTTVKKQECIGAGSFCARNWKMTTFFLQIRKKMVETISDFIRMVSYDIKMD